MNPKFQAGQIICYAGCIAKVIRFINRRNGVKVYEMEDISLNDLNKQREPGDVNEWSQAWVEKNWHLISDTNTNKIWRELNL